MSNLNIYYGSEVINRKGHYILTKPLNEGDTNYHLYDRYEQNEYLIDTEDVQNYESELMDYGGILYSDLVELLDIEEIKNVAWKTNLI